MSTIASKLLATIPSAKDAHATMVYHPILEQGNYLGIYSHIIGITGYKHFFPGRARC